MKGLTGQIEYQVVDDNKTVLYIKLFMDAKLFEE
jgi:hypothetical protein